MRVRTVAIGVLVSAFVISMGAFDADAQRRGKKRRAERGTPHSKAISGMMGDLKWGMTKNQVMNHFIKKLKEEYRPKFAKAPGTLEEDRLRHELNEKIRRIKTSFVRFEGRTTGWDVSFLRNEYTHNNNESMFVVRDEQAQNFYFFINDRFWKWYRAFNQEVFAGANFEQFSTALQGRFGQARERTGTIQEGGPEKHWLEWQDPKTRLRAIDETRFYGFYCLVFEDKSTLAELDTLRAVRDRRDDKRTHGLVDAVTSGDEAASPDEDADIVDRITGRIRNRQQAPKED